MFRFIHVSCMNRNVLVDNLQHKKIRKITPVQMGQDLPKKTEEKKSEEEKAADEEDSDKEAEPHVAASAVSALSRSQVLACYGLSESDLAAREAAEQRRRDCREENK